jgi:hypothetical protein
MEFEGLQYWEFLSNIFNLELPTPKNMGYQLLYRKSWQITLVLVEKKALCETANSRYAYMIKMR